ncbi:MAG TPA: methyltransferase domain-containing protein, partial [Mycobacteriales bacterium]|nr:methyltransferase domain-containing protein [Mycobacteriales bacterium]
MTGARAHYAALDDPDSQTAPEEVREALREFLAEFRPDGRLLDLGTGVGGNLALAAPSVPALVGAELSLTAARLAAQRLLAPVLVADGARMPFAAGVFATVVCTEVLEHVDDPRAVFAEIARVLRPGGLAFVTTPNYANAAGLHKWIA